MGVAAGTLVCAGLALVLAAYAPADIITALVVVAIVLFAAGWGRLTHAPAPAVSGVVVALIGLASVVAVRVTMDAAWATIVGAFALVVAFLGEMFRGRSRTSVLGSLATSITGVIIALSSGGWVALENCRMWLVLAYPMGICLVVAGLCLLVKGELWVRASVSILACTLAGLAAVGIVKATGLGGDDSILVLTTSVGAAEPLIAMLTIFGAFGLVAGLVVAGCHILFSGRMRPTSVIGAVALGLIPWLTMAVPVYAFARLAGV